MSPEDAFAVLGEATRLEILRVLGAAERPLSFSGLFDRVDYDHSSNFNYHLEKLDGHFVEKTDEGYELRQPGARVVEAILSGAINEAPTIAPTRVGHDCLLCGAPTVVTYRDEIVELYCTECDGVYGPPETDDGDATVPDEVADCGSLGGFELPPAGLQGRGLESAFETAEARGVSELLLAGRGVCPRCTAPVETETRVCPDHDATTEQCPDCGRQFAVTVRSSCTRCPHEGRGLIAHYVLSNVDVLSFLTANGVDPLAPMPEFYRVLIDHEETVLSTDPLEARLTFTVGEDSLTLTVDEDLSVVDAVRRRPSGGGG